MQPRSLRHLFDLCKPNAFEARTLQKPRELTWYEYLLVLLQIGASIEHALMVQYLYAAYSLKDEGPAKKWRQELLLVAREEMGHLLTVQNVLAFLGGPFNFDREDYPWDVPFDAFPFQLEPVSKGSLACYVYAEMAPHRQENKRSMAIRGIALRHIHRQRKKSGIRSSIKELPKDVRHVGVLYHHIVRILADKEKIPDAAILGHPNSGQMSWAEWGRGLRPNKQKVDEQQKIVDRPNRELRSPANVIITTVMTREQALLALGSLATQGEGRGAVKSQIAQDTPLIRSLAAALPDAPEWTHYDRFIEIRRQFRRTKNASKWVWQVPINPVTDPLPNMINSKGKITAAGKNRVITDIRSHRLAGLFNIRYRMLLSWLTHAHATARRDPSSAASPIFGHMMQLAFGEMITMKWIAEALVRMPFKRDQAKRDHRRAGPPFEMPFRLASPSNEHDLWRVHQEAFHAADRLCGELLHDKKYQKIDEELRRSLGMMLEADAQAIRWIEAISAEEKRRVA